MEGVYDMSNADDESQSGPNMEGLQDISNPDDAAQYTGLPDLEDVSTPPDGASGPSIVSGPKTGDSSLVFRAATEEEQKQRQAEIAKQAELDMLQLLHNLTIAEQEREQEEKRKKRKKMQKKDSNKKDKTTEMNYNADKMQTKQQK